MANLPRMALSGFRKFSSTSVLKAGAEAYNKDAESSREMWKKVTFFVALPAIALCMVNTYIEHLKHPHGDRPEFVPYDYLRLRNKRFPWGDGLRSFFHNKEVNALPDGYEE